MDTVGRVVFNITKPDLLDKIREALDEHHATMDVECDMDCFCHVVDDILLEGR